MRVCDVIERVMKDELSWRDAEEILGYSPRHIRRLRSTVLRDGPRAARDKRQGRSMPFKIPKVTVERVIALRKERYARFNVAHFHNKLEAEHRIEVSYTWLRNLLRQVGLLHGGREKGVHRMRRQRRPRCGMMLHIDASSHAWMGECYERRDLILIQDDADSRILYGQFVVEESTKTCLTGILSVLQRYGLFSELYSDRGRHFTLTRKAGEPCEDGNVQIARILRRLHITPIYAYSPQARGRSERTFATFQGRLPNELLDAGIANWTDANRYLNEVFIPDFNRRFTEAPHEPESAFILARGIDLSRACALEHPITVGNDNCVRWRHRIFQIQKHPSRPTFSRCRAMLVEYLDGRIDIDYGPNTIARFAAPGLTIGPDSPKQRPAKYRRAQIPTSEPKFQHFAGHL